MTKEKESIFSLPEEIVASEKNLVLFNDDVNTFDYVIETLVEVCEHTFEQAETCAWITHYKGKCSVKSGAESVLKPYQIELLNRHLTASIL